MLNLMYISLSEQSQRTLVLSFYKKFLFNCIIYCIYPPQKVLAPPPSLLWGKYSAYLQCLSSPPRNFFIKDYPLALQRAKKMDTTYMVSISIFYNLYFITYISPIISTVLPGHFLTVRCLFWFSLWIHLFL